MIGQGGMAVYTAAKSAVLGLTRSLARDYGQFNIRVNTVAPGWIMTERQIEKWLTPEGEAELMKRQCLKRRLQPAELAKFTLFLRRTKPRPAPTRTTSWTAAGSKLPNSRSTPDRIGGIAPCRRSMNRGNS